MPIMFRVNSRKGYFISVYRGHLAGEEHLLTFERFFSGPEWSPGLNELALAVDLESSSISTKSLGKLVALKNSFYEEHNVKRVRIAVYAPGDLAFGLARMYDSISEVEQSPEEVKPFRNIREALRWLNQ